MSNLTQLAEQAFNGDRTACRSFLRSFLQTELLIPDRKQHQTLSGIVEPPSPFFPFFAFESEGETFVPVFEHEEQIASFTLAPLSHRRYLGRQLFGLVPSSWWVVFNPGSEVEKVFSPWEISLLRSGSEEAIAEVVAELFDSASDEFLDARMMSPVEHPQLFESFSHFCHTTSSIVAGWVLEISPIAADNISAREVVVGVMTAPIGDTQADTERAAALHRQLELMLGPLLIGWGTIRISVIAEGDKSVIGELLSSHPPFYQCQNP